MKRRAPGAGHREVDGGASSSHGVRVRCHSGESFGMSPTVGLQGRRTEEVKWAVARNVDWTRGGSDNTTDRTHS